MEKEKARVDIVSKLDDYIGEKISNLSNHAFDREQVIEKLEDEKQLVEQTNQFQKEHSQNSLENEMENEKPEIERISVDLGDEFSLANELTQMITKTKVVSKDGKSIG